MLALLVLFTAPSAHAQSTPGGHYTVSYSGGQITRHNADATTTSFPYSPITGPPLAWGTSFNFGPSCSLTSTGPITATFTWQPDTPNAPPPASVIVEQDCTIMSYMSGGVTGTMATGLGHSGTAGGVPPDTVYTGVSNPGKSFSITPPCTPVFSLTASATSGMSGGSINYHALAYPVYISLQGTTPDSSGNLNILVGQGCTSSLNTPPFSVAQQSGWSWSVSGTTFQSWTANSPNNVDASSYVDGPGPLTNSTAGWYWNDFQSPKSETVSCTATVTPPAGQGSAFTVTATQQVTVYRPYFTATGFGGGMEVSTAAQGGLPGNGANFWLWAGALPGTGQNGGMDMRATVAPPLGTGTLFGPGTLQLVQLVIPDMTYTSSNGLWNTTYTWSLNGEEGLDTSYPYGWLVTGAPNYHSFDAPGVNLTLHNDLAATLGDQFQDYLVYFPPGSAQCVPVATFVWTTNGSASVTNPNNWAYIAPGLAGSVSPSNTLTNFVPTNGWPMWTQNDAVANAHWQ